MFTAGKRCRDEQPVALELLISTSDGANDGEGGWSWQVLGSYLILEPWHLYNAALNIDSTVE